MEIKWRCESCGETFDECVKDYTEGGYRGEPHYSCPFCGSDYLEEMHQCELCGEWYPADELHGWVNELVCDKCMDEHTDIETVLDFAKGNVVEVEIPAIIADTYSEEEITEMLYKWFRENLTESEQLNMCKEEVSCNKSEFAEYLAMK